MDVVVCASKRTGNESGQVVPLLALVVMLAAVALMAMVRVGTALDDSARARTAADAAALAGVAEGRVAAAELATANGGDLLSFRSDGHTALVEVRVGTATARARAAASVDRVSRSG